MDVPEISSDLPGNSGAREAGSVGTGGRDVGGTGFEYAGRRIAGAAAADWEAILPRQVRSGRAHRVESGFIWLQLAAAADLQKIRRGLFCDAEDGLERHQSPALQAFLVGIAGWQQGAGLFSARLCAGDRAGTAGGGRGAGAATGSGAAGDDASVWRGRSRRRADAGDAGRGRPLDRSEDGLSEDVFRKRAGIFFGCGRQARYGTFAGVELQDDRGRLDTAAGTASGDY